MKSALVILSFTILISACSNQESKTGETNTTDSSNVINKPIVADSTLSGCYSLIANRDTASLQIQVKDSSATGSLSYNLFEKDRNDGTFEGEIHNGIITGWYLFRSEGVMSVRQVAWKIDNNALIPAQGEVIVRNDSTLFKDISKLQFDTVKPFVKTQCVI